MENREFDSILHDFRRDVVMRKRSVIWEEWDNWNILYKTIEYELSSSRDVESYKYVKEKAFEKYCPDYEKYKTADVMNGWWYCFKVIFDIKSSRRSDETKRFLDDLNHKIEGMKEQQVVKFLCEHYKKEERLYAVLLEFLKVVYTVGNITPAKENKNRARLDNWEIKLEKGGWSNKEKKDLHYYMYVKDEIIRVEDNNLVTYMEERIGLILCRALQVEGHVDNDYLNELRKRIMIRTRNEGF